MTTKRKVLLVDLDNVVYPWAEVMAHIVVREGLAPNMSPAELMGLYRSWNVWDDWAVPKGGFNRVWEASIVNGEMWGVGAEGVTAMPVDRSVRGLWQLSDDEWHIHLVTHRLNKFRLHDQAVRNTGAWLNHWNIPYRSLTFTEDKSLIHGDVLIDDNPNNLINHPAPVKILYPAPHNKEWREKNEDAYPDILRVADREMNVHPWDEIVEMLS